MARLVAPLHPAFGLALWPLGPPSPARNPGQPRPAGILAAQGRHGVFCAAFPPSPSNLSSAIVRVLTASGGVAGVGKTQLWGIMLSFAIVWIEFSGCPYEFQELEKIKVL